MMVSDKSIREGQVLNGEFDTLVRLSSRTQEHHIDEIFSLPLAA
jgi:hypothetical protein